MRWKQEHEHAMVPPSSPTPTTPSSVPSAASAPATTSIIEQPIVTVTNTAVPPATIATSVTIPEETALIGQAATTDQTIPQETVSDCPNTNIDTNTTQVDIDDPEHIS